MSDAMERLKSALADRYAIEHELGVGGIHPAAVRFGRGRFFPLLRHAVHRRRDAAGQAQSPALMTGVS